jgi:SNF2 family DNA or RNA helicase
MTPAQAYINGYKEAADKLEDVITGDELKNVNKYVLSKNELQKPRELSDEEKRRIAFRRKAGWSLFNPIYDLEKRDVFHQIQNPLYRATLDTLGSGVGGVLGGAITGMYTNMIMGHEPFGHPKAKGGLKNVLTRPPVLLGILGGIPALMKARHEYLRQKLYNDITEEYIKHHAEGQIDTMSNILRDMTEKKKNVSSLVAPKKKVKTAEQFLKADYIPGRAKELEKVKNIISGLFGVYNLAGGYLDYKRNKNDINDIKERFERKLKNKREADIFVNKVRMPLYRKNIGADEKIQKFHELFKESEDKAPLLPHQQRIIEKLQQSDQPGLILMHGLGSGKTRSSIEAYKNLGLPAEVVLPAALKGNYEKEIKRWVGKSPKDLHITSQQEVARKGIPADNYKDKLMIIDEAHRLRNEDTKLYKALKGSEAKKRVLLTGTPIYNDPSDIAKLINVAAGKTILPERKPEFEKEFIAQKTVFPTLAHRILGVSPGQELSVKNKDYLRAVFKKMIDYHAGNAEGMPEVSKEVVRVPMHEKQQQLYKAMMKELPWYLRMKVSAGLPPDKKELDKLIPFLSGARMISNTTSGFTKDEKDIVSPKVEQAFKFFKENIDKDPTYKGLIYSNYLKSGVEPYKKLLDANKIPYGEFTGEINDKIRQQLVNDYNANKLKALIVSSAGGEGLDLKGTRLVQLLEPHFNNEKIKQVIGRAARYKSHEALDPEKRKVLIQSYLSSLNPGIIDKLRRKRPVSTDEYLQNLSDEKEKLNEEFIKLIRG